MDTGSFNAFSSPNLAPLANAEVDITSKQSRSEPFQFIKSRGFFFYWLSCVSVVFSQLGYRVEGQHHSQVSSLHRVEQERGPAQALSWDHRCYRKHPSSGDIWVCRGRPCQWYDVCDAWETWPISVQGISTSHFWLHFQLDYFSSVNHESEKKSISMLWILY